MKILLVYPEYPDTFWSFKHALKFVGKKAAFPPLGLLTVAAMLPMGWEKKLVDMNVHSLTDGQIEWADYIFISAMEVQKNSAKEIIDRANVLGKKIVAGGPLFTTAPEQFPEVDHLVLNEAEITLPPFLKDLSSDRIQRIYSSNKHPEITDTPLPLWELIRLGDYSCMSIQYSRGCPFDCEFCDITFLDGHVPRTKSKDQIIAEMDLLYEMGWRGSVFIVDDNFISNKKKLKEEVLPAIILWQKKKKYPFSFLAEASINLADDEDLMKLMAKAGFDRVFVGIETPHQASLVETGKKQNIDRDLIADVKTLQNHGLEVMGGFIVGFDSDDPVTIFDAQIDFIQKSGIVVAMVGLLNAPRGTHLHERLQREGRLREGFSGDNMDSSLNFVPKMKRQFLIEGYRRILNTIYAPRQYYERVEMFLKEYKPKTKNRFSWYQFVGLINCLIIVGMRDNDHNGRRYFWKLFFITLIKRPRSFPIFIMQAIYGHHFRKVVSKII
ncbi:MAG: B12-binding domain-containing radical SAM protein [Patescibacteria group bacterium]